MVVVFKPKHDILIFWAEWLEMVRWQIEGEDENENVQVPENNNSNNKESEREIPGFLSSEDSCDE